MIAPSLPEGAELFHRLHDSAHPLILVNAWDAGSARVIEQAGAKAIATTSAGVAWSLGYRDGEHAPPRDIVDACARICRAVRVPVSVDIERGFGPATGDVSSFVQALIQLGIAGINIEDGVLPGGQQLAPPEILCARIAVVRAAASLSPCQTSIIRSVSALCSQLLRSTTPSSITASLPAYKKRRKRR